MRKRFLRSLILSALVSLIAAYIYLHLRDTENIEIIAIVILLFCGAGIGIFIMSIAGLFFWKKDQ